MIKNKTETLVTITTVTQVSEQFFTLSKVLIDTRLSSYIRLERLD